MPQFAYTARTESGQDVTGSIAAETKRDVLAALADRALFPLTVENADKSKTLWQLQRRIKGELLASTLAQMSDLLQNGVPLLRSLDVLAEQATHPRLQHVLGDVRNQISEGETLDEAFRSHPDVFSELTVSIVRAGTEGAFLEGALKQTAEFLEMQDEMRARVRGAMIYPVFLAIVGTAVTLGLIIFLVPKFAELFEDLRRAGTLPAPTIILLWLSDFLGRFWFIAAGGVLGIVLGVKHWMASEKGRIRVDQWKLKIPIAGPIFLNSATSRFCRILGTLLRNGVPLLKALDISSDSSGNHVMSTAIRESAKNVSAGATLSAPLAECGLMPKNIMAMITIAEESNNLEDVLNNVADGIDRKINRQLDTMVRLIETLMLMLMGGAILFVIVALLLPVIEMSTAMG